MSKKPIWYLAGPFFRYAEDVKALAAKAGVRIVDANVTTDRSNAAPEKDLPKVTLLPEYGGKVKAEAPAEKKAREKAEKEAATLAESVKAAAALTGQQPPQE